MIKSPQSKKRAAARRRSDECALEVFELPFENGRHVVADGDFPPLARAEEARDQAVTLLLGARDRLRRERKDVARARLDLDEAVRPLVKGDDVRFAEGRLIVARNDAVAAPLQIFADEGLSLPSQNFVTKVLRWIGHMPTSRMALMCAAVP